MKSHAIPRFWRLFHALPPEVQRLAVKTFRLWQRNPNHPSLRYRRLEDELLRSYPSLRAEDLVNAWAYVRSHRAEIEDEIRQNEDA